MNRFEHLVFDLDDTLLDTSRQLVPRASQDACKAMIEAGLDADLQQCLNACENHRASRSRLSLFSHLVESFGTLSHAKTEDVTQVGYKGFYNREVEMDISISEDVLAMLEDLKTRYNLHLVTAGHRPTQESKVRILKIEYLFQTIHYVDPIKNEHKGQAFKKIATQFKAPAASHLSIGNRVDTDIGEARKIGWRGCWVRYGEYAHLQPRDEFERPDFTIDQIQELPKACRL